MPNVQQPEMRRSGQTRLVQDSDGPPAPRRRSRRGERHPVPAEQTSPHDPQSPVGADAQQPNGREAEGD